MDIQCPDCQRKYSEYDAHGIAVEIYNQCLMCRIAQTNHQEMLAIDRRLKEKLQALQKKRTN